MNLHVVFSQVDRGHGVHKKSQLVFDVKSGRYSHIAIRGFSLAELFVGKYNFCLIGNAVYRRATQLSFMKATLTSDGRQ